MVDELIRISEFFLDKIYESGGEKLLEEEIILSKIMRLQQKMPLSLKFNIKHNILEHNYSYELVNCEQEHCFDCLNTRLVEGFTNCEHGPELSAYEKVHIAYIFKGLAKDDA